MFIRLKSADSERTHDILIYWRAVQGVEKITTPAGKDVWTIVHTAFGTRYVKESPSEIIGLVEAARDLELRDAAHSKNVCSA